MMCSYFSLNKYVRISITSYREDYLICCPFIKVIKSDSKRDVLCDSLQAKLPPNSKTHHTQEEGHTGLLNLASVVLALLFIASRIQPS